MKILKRIQSIYKNIKTSLRRFPVTIAISTAFVLISIIISESDLGYQDPIMEVYRRIRMIIALAIPLSLCITSLGERRSDLKRTHKILAYGLGAGGLILYYLFLLRDFSWVPMVRYTAVSLFFYLAFLYLPRLKQEDDYEFYIINVLSSFFLTGLYSLVLLLGVFAIYFTLNQLFNINIPSNTYYYSFLIVAGIFAPSMFLARVPEGDEDLRAYNYPKGLKALLIYIVLPLISIYTLILYIYFGQILIRRNWPEGLVSHLVLWYSSLAVGVIFFLSPIVEENLWARRFKKYFPKLNIPILVMMFVSMGIRINQYGITENRYFALVLGLWVLGIMLYFILAKKQSNIIIPIVLSILMINSVFGPLSSFALAKRSQNHRLTTILLDNNMLEEDHIKKNQAIEARDKEEISMILDYFNSNHSLNQVKYLPKDFEIEDMTKTFGFSFTEPSLIQDNYFYLALESDGMAIVDVKDYDYYIESLGHHGPAMKLDDLRVSYSRETMVLSIIKGDGPGDKFNLKDQAKAIILGRKEKINQGRNVLRPEEVRIIEEREDMEVEFLIKTISGKFDRGENLQIDHIEFSALIRMK